MPSAHSFPYSFLFKTELAITVSRTVPTLDPYAFNWSVSVVVHQAAGMKAAIDGAGLQRGVCNVRNEAAHAQVYDVRTTATIPKNRLERTTKLTRSRSPINVAIFPKQLRSRDMA